MARVALNHAHRVYCFSETIVALLAQANIPYAAQLLPFLQVVQLLIARVAVNLT